MASSRFSGFSAYTPVYSVALNHDGTALALGGGHHRDGIAQVRTLHAGTEFPVMPGHAGLFESVAFSPHGNTLASGSTDKTVRLWDVTTRAPIAILQSHAGWVESVAFSPDGQTLASGGTDSSVRIWKVP